MTALVTPKTDTSGLVRLGAVGFKIFSSFLKIAKSLKFLLAAGTFGAYTFMFSWKFAILVMLGIGLHEMGHVWAMRRCGIPTRGFYFIPLVGGAAVSDGAFKSGRDEIFIALMGPFVGFLTAIVPLILFGVTGSPFWAAAASWLAMVNLFNLFPVNPLDGGRFVKSIAFSLNSTIGVTVLVVGFVTAAILAYITGLNLLWLTARHRTQVGTWLRSPSTQREMAVVGELLRIDFSQKRLWILYPPASREIECSYLDDVEDSILDGRRGQFRQHRSLRARC